MSVSDVVHFRMMSLVHETLYGLFRDPYEALKAAGLRQGQDVLEVGCGPGFFTIPAAKMVGGEGSVRALDISPAAVKRVRQKIEEAGATNVTTTLADAAATGLPDESFDLILVFGFRRNAEHMGGMLPELHRLLRPGGVLSTEGRLWNSSDLFRLTKQSGRILQFEKVEQHE
jgi:ubiquinone/menaquinone biosynthesis C-methylase UbiE